MPNETEVWQRGAVPGYARELQPVVHALLQVSEEIALHASALTDKQLSARPHGVASVGFHLLHIAGATDRLLTYARGETLNEVQKTALRAEAVALPAGTSAATLVTQTQQAIQRALQHVLTTSPDTLFEPRYIGRARLGTTVWGLLFHTAEHATRHAGQLATTCKFLMNDVATDGIMTLAQRADSDLANNAGANDSNADSDRTNNAPTNNAPTNNTPTNNAPRKNAHANNVRTNISDANTDRTDKSGVNNDSANNERANG